MVMALGLELGECYGLGWSQASAMVRALGLELGECYGQGFRVKVMRALWLGLQGCCD